MKLHTDPIREARHDGMPPPSPAVDWRPMHHGGRRVPGLRRLRPYRAVLICRLWRALCPHAPQPGASTAHATVPRQPHQLLDPLPHPFLGKLLNDIARLVVRRIRRDPAILAPRRTDRRPLRATSVGGAWWQRYSPCDGMPAAARDGTGR